MHKGKRIVCVIPARGASKGLPGKNIKLLNGKPLIAHSIEQARASGICDRIIVSTDDGVIAGIAGEYGAEVPFMRPKRLARDDTGTIDVLLHCVDWLENSGCIFDVVVLLHATAPLRLPGDISECVKMLFSEDASNVFSVSPAHRNPYFNMVELRDDKVCPVKKGRFTSRQSAPGVYDMNASIYVWWKDVLKARKKVFCENSRIYIMPKERSIDIDDETDFEIAEFLSGKRCKFKSGPVSQ